ncbi:MAG: hypothetical protein N3D16_10460 [Anaerolineales bacterium]|nr:hypothetical protein [Anaerolineales bacterium]
MDTNTAFELLQRSLQDLCDAFNQKKFFPLLEADLAAYLYHRLLENGAPLSEVFSETRLCGISKGERKFDLVIGTVDTTLGCIYPVLVIQIKAFQRWGHSPKQHRRRFEKILSEDIPSLKQASSILQNGRVEVIVDLVLRSQYTGYLSGKWNGRTRRDVLEERCKEAKIALFWVRPNPQDQIEVEQVV